MSKIIISILVVIFSVLLPGDANNVEVNISESITQESTYIEYSIKNNTGRIINPLITFKSLEKSLVIFGLMLQRIGMMNMFGLIV